MLQICNAKGCLRVAIEGERYCDPCLEAIEDGHVPNAKKGKQRKAGYQRPEVTGAALTPQEKMDNVTDRFEAAQEVGDRIRMFDFCYQARRISKVHGLELPEWAGPLAPWRVLEMVKSAGFEAGASGMTYEDASVAFRKAYADGAVSAAGATTRAAKQAGLHRNTLERFRKGAA